MVLDSGRLLLAEPQERFLDHFTGAFDVTENPHGIADEMALMSFQRSHDPCGFRPVFHLSLTCNNVRRRCFLGVIRGQTYKSPNSGTDTAFREQRRRRVAGVSVSVSP